LGFDFVFIFGILLEKETDPYQNQKDYLRWGKLAAGTKATAGNARERAWV